MNKNMQYLLDLINGKIPPPGIVELLGMRITEFCDGCTTVEIPVESRLFNPMRTLHGGIYCDVADAAMGLSFFTTLEEHESFTTVDLRINFLKPVTAGKLIASSKIIKRGRRLGYMECEIKDSQGDLVAKASSTCIIVDKTDLPI